MEDGYPQDVYFDWDEVVARKEQQPESEVKPISPVSRSISRSSSRNTKVFDSDTDNTQWNESEDDLYSEPWSPPDALPLKSTDRSQSFDNSCDRIVEDEQIIFPSYDKDEQSNIYDAQLPVLSRPGQLEVKRHSHDD